MAWMYRKLSEAFGVRGRRTVGSSECGWDAAEAGGIVDSEARNFEGKMLVGLKALRER